MTEPERSPAPGEFVGPVLRSPEPVEWKRAVGATIGAAVIPTPDLRGILPAANLTEALQAAYERGIREGRKQGMERAADMLENCDGTKLDIHEFAAAIRAEAEA